MQRPFEGKRGIQFWLGPFTHPSHTAHDNDHDPTVTI